MPPMKARPLARLAFLLVPCAALNAQTGTIDQVSPYPPNPPVQTAWFNGDASFLIWQQQVRAGIAGQLEGVELYINGLQNSTMDVRIRIGDAWNTGPIAFQALVTKL